MTHPIDDRNIDLNPGRACPPDYHYPPTEISGEPAVPTDTLYVVGGLYGNPFALHEVQKLVDLEPPHTNLKLVFNGDFNWFNRHPEDFEQINQHVLMYDAIRGNVETEISRDSFSGGCGCGYPDSISDNVVSWSNEIISLLHRTAAGYPDIQNSLQQLPMFRRYQVGDSIVNVMHGDCHSLAGWSLSRQNLLTHPEAVIVDANASAANIIACTHTCEPYATTLGDADNRVAIINNGAAGMPNLNNGTYGIITRIASTPSAIASIYGTQFNAVYIDAIAVHYQQHNLLDWFCKHWPEGSAAHQSYFSRLHKGTHQTLVDTIGGSFEAPELQ